MGKTVMADTRDTIIIAESDPTTLQTLDARLTAEGYRVLPFKDQKALLQLKDLNDHPSVLILGDIGGVGLLRDLRKSGWEIPVIFLHSSSSINEAVSAIRAGADDYVTKPFCAETLVLSIKRSLEKVRSQLRATKTNHDLLSKAASLTERECEIINLVLAGLLNKQIAAQLNLALVTVKFHRGKAMRKLGARTAGELARLAKEAGITATHPNSHLLPITPSQSSSEAAG